MNPLSDPWRAAAKWKTWCVEGLMVLLILMPADVEALGEEAPSEESRALLETVIAGIDANYSQIQTLEAVAEWTLLDATVEKEEIRKIATSGGGGSGSFRVAPKIVRRMRFFLEGDRLRRDTFRSPADTQAMESLLFRDGAWTQYVPEAKAVWIRSSDVMPGADPADIRNLGSPSPKETVQAVLRKAERVAARLVDGPEGHAIIEIVTQRRGFKHEWAFDPARGYLPARYTAHHDDGSISRTIRVTSQPVLDGTVWLPVEERMMVFAKGVAAAPLEDKWTQCRIVRVKEVVTINGPLSEDCFELTLPDGTRVRDGVKHREHVVGQPDRRSSNASRPLGQQRADYTGGWWLVHCGALLVLCVVLVLRKSRRFKSTRRPQA